MIPSILSLAATAARPALPNSTGAAPSADGESFGDTLQRAAGIAAGEDRADGTVPAVGGVAAARAHRADAAAETGRRPRRDADGSADPMPDAGALAAVGEEPADAAVAAESPDPAAAGAIDIVALVSTLAIALPAAPASPATAAPAPARRSAAVADATDAAATTRPVATAAAADGMARPTVAAAVAAAAAPAAAFVAAPSAAPAIPVAHATPPDDSAATAAGTLPPEDAGAPDPRAGRPATARPGSALPPTDPAPVAAALAAAGRAARGVDAIAERNGGRAIEPAAPAAPQAAPQASPALPEGLAGLALAPARSEPVTQRPEAAVPVAASIDEPVGTPDFAHALGVRLTVFAREGIEQARLDLHPAELGPIAVQLALDGAQLRVDFSADVAATRQALEQALPGLASTLAEAGLTLSGGGVSQQMRDGAGRDRAGTPGTSPRRTAGVDATATTAQEPVLRTRTVRLDGLVDLYA